MSMEPGAAVDAAKRNRQMGKNSNIVINMDFFKKLKKTVLGHEEIELADILQAVLFIMLLALLLFIALKTSKAI